MTREEAIELLEERKKFNRTMQRGWEQSEGVTASGKTVNTASFAKQHKDEADALDLALAAIRSVSRERVKKVWRGCSDCVRKTCVACKHFGWAPRHCVDCENQSKWAPWNFCPYVSGRLYSGSGNKLAAKCS